MKRRQHVGKKRHRMRKRRKARHTEGGHILEVTDFFALKDVLKVPGGRELINRLRHLERS